MIIARNKKLAAFFTILSIIYLSLSVLVPPDKVTLARYHITRSQDAGLTFTITIPYLIIWFVALVGYSRLKSYSDKISRSKDGAAFQTISKGILWLSLWLPISAVMNTLFNSYYHYHPSATAWLVNVNNYLNIILLLTAFWFIYNGTKQLLGVIKKPSSQLPSFNSPFYNFLGLLFVFGFARSESSISDRPRGGGNLLFARLVNHIAYRYTSPNYLALRYASRL
jgi:hypothetical protein